jgi:hypothetical protein
MVSLAVVSCHFGACDDDDFTECEPPTEAALSDALSDAGLFADMTTEALAEGV